MDAEAKKNLRIKGLELTDRLKEILEEENEIRSLLSQAKLLVEDKPKDQFDQPLSEQEVTLIHQRFSKRLTDFESRKPKPSK